MSSIFRQQALRVLVDTPRWDGSEGSVTCSASQPASALVIMLYRAISNNPNQSTEAYTDH